jgi:leucyl/phenylalanyl-tRNA---protein transferase
MGLGDVLKLPLIEGLFPDPKASNEDGIVCIGGPLNLPVLVTAYYNGIFPWPHQGLPLLWFSPVERGILHFDHIHLSRSLKRAQKKLNLEFTSDRAFSKVIDYCSKVPRKGQSGTWITSDIKKAYKELHEAGYALSIEAWIDKTLVGGIYGVFVAGVFSAESMFGLKSDVSKLCVLAMTERLKNAGLTWMDIQMVTQVTGSLGGEPVARADYLKMLKQSHKLFEKKRLVAP